MFVAEVTGCSSWARLGISVHKTAGYANLGHEFKWILEVDVVHPVKIYPNMKIGQCVFHTTYGGNGFQYNGIYKDKQKDNKQLTGSLYNQDAIREDNRKKEFDKLDAEFVSKSPSDKRMDVERFFDAMSDFP